MSSHLPECNCTCSDCCGSSSPCRYCICNQLRACEQRVTEEVTARLTTAYEWVVTDERNRALDAAREAVAALAPTTVVFHGQLPVVHNVRITDALATVDALRGDDSVTSRQVTEPSRNSGNRINEAAQSDGFRGAP